MLSSLRSGGYIFAITVLLFTFCGCRSYWVETTVENHTGHPIHEVEVDYPSASFGINALSSGASMHYRFKILGSGPVKVQYVLDNGKSVNSQGLNLFERQQGRLTLVLLPEGKVDFLPELKPAS